MLNYQMNIKQQQFINNYNKEMAQYQRKLKKYFQVMKVKKIIYLYYVDIHYLFMKQYL